MRNSKLVEEKRLLQFLDEEEPTVVPSGLFKRKTVKELQAYELVEIIPSGACILTEKGKYIKRMTSNPKIELHTKGNYILNLKLKTKDEPVDQEQKKIKNWSFAAVAGLVISILLLPLELLRTP